MRDQRYMPIKISILFILTIFLSYNIYQITEHSLPYLFESISISKIIIWASMGALIVLPYHKLLVLDFTKYGLVKFAAFLFFGGILYWLNDYASMAILGAGIITSWWVIKLYGFVLDDEFSPERLTKPSRRYILVIMSLYIAREVAGEVLLFKIEYVFTLLFLGYFALKIYTTKIRYKRIIYMFHRGNIYMQRKIEQGTLSKIELEKLEKEIAVKKTTLKRNIISMFLSLSFSTMLFVVTTRLLIQLGIEIKGTLDEVQLFIFSSLLIFSFKNASIDAYKPKIKFFFIFVKEMSTMTLAYIFFLNIATIASSIENFDNIQNDIFNIYVILIVSMYFYMKFIGTFYLKLNVTYYVKLLLTIAVFVGYRAIDFIQQYNGTTLIEGDIGYVNTISWIMVGIMALYTFIIVIYEEIKEDAKLRMRFALESWLIISAISFMFLSLQLDLLSDAFNSPSLDLTSIFPADPNPFDFNQVILPILLTTIIFLSTDVQSKLSKIILISMKVGGSIWLLTLLTQIKIDQGNLAPVITFGASIFVAYTFGWCLKNKTFSFISALVFVIGNILVYEMIGFLLGLVGMQSGFIDLEKSRLYFGLFIVALTAAYIYLRNIKTNKRSLFAYPVRIMASSAVGLFLVFSMVVTGPAATIKDKELLNKAIEMLMDLLGDKIKPDIPFLSTEGLTDSVILKESTAYEYSYNPDGLDGGWNFSYNGDASSSSGQNHEDLESGNPTKDRIRGLLQPTAPNWATTSNGKVTVDEPRWLDQNRIPLPTLFSNLRTNQDINIKEDEHGTKTGTVEKGLELSFERYDVNYQDTQTALRLAQLDTTNTMPAEVGRYLGEPTNMRTLMDAAFADYQASTTLTGPLANTKVVKITTVIEYVRKEFEIKVAEEQIKDFWTNNMDITRAWTTKKANIGEAMLVATALMRRINIPTRTIKGYLATSKIYPSITMPSFEFYLNGLGFVPGDAFAALMILDRDSNVAPGDDVTEGQLPESTVPGEEPSPSVPAPNDPNSDPTQIDPDNSISKPNPGEVPGKEGDSTTGQDVVDGSNTGDNGGENSSSTGSDFSYDEPVLELTKLELSNLITVKDPNTDANVTIRRSHITIFYNLGDETLAFPAPQWDSLTDMNNSIFRFNGVGTYQISYDVPVPSGGANVKRTVAVSVVAAKPKIEMHPVEAIEATDNYATVADSTMAVNGENIPIKEIRLVRKQSFNVCNVFTNMVDRFDGQLNGMPASQQAVTHTDITDLSVGTTLFGCSIVFNLIDDLDFRIRFDSPAFNAYNPAWKGTGTRRTDYYFRIKVYDNSQVVDLSTNKADADVYESKTTIVSSLTGYNFEWLNGRKVNDAQISVDMLGRGSTDIVTFRAAVGVDTYSNLGTPNSRVKDVTTYSIASPSGTPIEIQRNIWINTSEPHDFAYNGGDVAMINGAKYEDYSTGNKNVLDNISLTNRVTGIDKGDMTFVWFYEYQNPTTGAWVGRTAYTLGDSMNIPNNLFTTSVTSIPGRFIMTATEGSTGVNRTFTTDQIGFRFASATLNLVAGTSPTSAIETNTVNLISKYNVTARDNLGFNYDITCEVRKGSDNTVVTTTDCELAMPYSNETSYAVTFSATDKLGNIVTENRTLTSTQNQVLINGQVTGTGRLQVYKDYKVDLTTGINITTTSGSDVTNDAVVTIDANPPNVFNNNALKEYVFNTVGTYTVVYRGNNIVANFLGYNRSATHTVTVEVVEQNAPPAVEISTRSVTALSSELPSMPIAKVFDKSIIPVIDNSISSLDVSNSNTKEMNVIQGKETFNFCEQITAVDQGTLLNIYATTIKDHEGNNLYEIGGTNDCLVERKREISHDFTVKGIQDFEYIFQDQVGNTSTAYLRINILENFKDSFVYNNQVHFDNKNRTIFTKLTVFNYEGKRYIYFFNGVAFEVEPTFLESKVGDYQLYLFIDGSKTWDDKTALIYRDDADVPSKVKDYTLKSSEITNCSTRLASSPHTRFDIEIKIDSSGTKYRDDCGNNYSVEELKKIDEIFKIDYQSGATYKFSGVASVLSGNKTYMLMSPISITLPTSQWITLLIAFGILGLLIILYILYKKLRNRKEYEHLLGEIGIEEDLTKEEREERRKNIIFYYIEIKKMFVSLQRILRRYLKLSFIGKHETVIEYQKRIARKTELTFEELSAMFNNVNRAIFFKGTVTEEIYNDAFDGYLKIANKIATLVDKKINIKANLSADGRSVVQYFDEVEKMYIHLQKTLAEHFNISRVKSSETITEYGERVQKTIKDENGIIAKLFEKIVRAMYFKETISAEDYDSTRQLYDDIIRLLNKDSKTPIHPIKEGE